MVKVHFNYTSASASNYYSFFQDSTCSYQNGDEEKLPEAYVDFKTYYTWGQENCGIGIILGNFRITDCLGVALKIARCYLNTIYKINVLPGEKIILDNNRIAIARSFQVIEKVTTIRRKVKY